MQNTVVCGRYRVGEQVWTGEGWTEFRGEDQSGQAVIIRKVEPQKEAVPELGRRLEAVREKLGLLPEQSCSPWLEICEHEGSVLIISPEVSGKSLAERIDSEGPLPFEDVFMLAHGLAVYLGSLHGAGLLQGAFIPGDLVFATEAAVPVVTSPALAAYLDLPVVPGSGGLCLAPELTSGETPDACSDVYALGAVLYQALTAHPVPMPDLSPGKTMIVTWLPGRLRSDIPEALDQLVGACLHPERGSRLSDADALLAAVEGMRPKEEEPAQPMIMGMEDSLVGQTLGPYRLVERLGQGGMAAVYKGYEAALNRYVAIKVLPQFFASDPNFTARFHREAKAVAQLTHPNIVPIYNFGEDNGITYIAMQLVHGGSLKYESGDRMGYREALQLLLPITRALGYAHHRGVVHRDVKPSNVLISEDGWPLLADFGLAKMAESTGEKLTGTGVGMGTPMYMSPEQGQGVNVDHRSDIYSLGIMLYELVTGDVPFRADTPMAIVIKHMTAPMPMPRSRNPEIPEAVESIILKATAKDKADRFQTAEEMVEAMERVLAGSPLPENLRMEPDQPPAPSPAKQKTAQSEKKPRGKPKPLQWVLYAVLGIMGACLLGVVMMGIFDICPPQGPWPQPPWCEGSPFQFTMGNAQPAQQPAPMTEPVEMAPSIELESQGEAVSADSTELEHQSEWREAASQRTIELTGYNPFAMPILQDDFTGRLLPGWTFTCDRTTQPWVVEEENGSWYLHALSGCMETGWFETEKTENYTIALAFKVLDTGDGTFQMNVGGRVVPGCNGYPTHYYAMVKGESLGLARVNCSPAEDDLVSQAARPIAVGEWHTLYLMMLDDRVMVWLDGELYLDYTDPDPIRDASSIWLSVYGESEILLDKVEVFQARMP